MKFETRNLKVVIVAGGDGTRLGELNKRREPKSFLVFKGKPLISYQLELLEKIGIKNLFISFNNKDQIKSFYNLINKGLVPKLNYTFGTHDPLSHPCILFRQNKIRDYLGKDDMLFLLGDLVIKNDLIKNILSAYEENNSTIIIREKARKNDLEAMITEKLLLVDIREEDKIKWRYGSIYLIKNRDIDTWFKTYRKKEIKTMSFFKDCLKSKSKVCVINNRLNSLININEPDDYYEAKKYFEKNNN